PTVIRCDPKRDWSGSVLLYLRRREVMLQPDGLLGREGQAELGAAPEDVVQAGCPLLLAKVIHFLRVQVLAELLAQLGHAASLTQHVPRAAAVEAGPALRQVQVDALYLRDQRFGQC